MKTPFDVNPLAEMKGDYRGDLLLPMLLTLHPPIFRAIERQCGPLSGFWVNEAVAADNGDYLFCLNGEPDPKNGRAPLCDGVRENGGVFARYLANYYVLMQCAKNPLGEPAAKALAAAVGYGWALRELAGTHLVPELINVVDPDDIVIPWAE